MPRETVPPTREPVRGIGSKTEDEIREHHPAFGLIGASRTQVGPKGAVLFDSEIRHRHTVRVTLRVASRQRSLSRDWIHGEEQLIEVEMSESQWASFVSSMNSGDGVPCTIRAREGEPLLPEMPFEPRMAESIAEVEGAADKALARIMAAFEKVEERPNKGNIRDLKLALEQAPGNMRFVANSLTEHVETTVDKARADLEAIVSSKAAQLGLDPADLGGVGLLGEGDPEAD